jgi:hypothetical protein
MVATFWCISLGIAPELPGSPIGTLVSQGYPQAILRQSPGNTQGIFLQSNGNSGILIPVSQLISIFGNLASIVGL